MFAIDLNNPIAIFSKTIELTVELVANVIASLHFLPCGSVRVDKSEAHPLKNELELMYLCHLDRLKAQ